MIRRAIVAAFVRRALIPTLTIAMLGGCSYLTDSMRSAGSIDYKSASTGPKLEVPPDLVTPKADNAFVVPPGLTVPHRRADRAVARSPAILG